MIMRKGKEAREIIEGLKQLTEVKVIVLAGSMGRGYQDKFSDIDYYVYCTKTPGEKNRKKIFRKLKEVKYTTSSGYMDFFKIDGTDVHTMWIEIKFLNKMVKLLSQGVYESNVENNIAHFIQNVKPIYDPNGVLKKLKNSVRYKKKLKISVYERNGLESIGNLYRDGIDTLLKRKNFFMIDWKMNMGINRIMRIIYSLNNKHYNEYPNWIHKDIKNFRVKPKKFYERLTEFSLLSTKKDLIRKLEILSELLCDTTDILEKSSLNIKVGHELFPIYRDRKWYRKRVKEIEKIVNKSKL